MEEGNKDTTNYSIAKGLKIEDFEDLVKDAMDSAITNSLICGAGFMMNMDDDMFKAFWNGGGDVTITCSTEDYTKIYERAEKLGLKTK